VNAGRIDQDDLGVVTIQDSLDSIASGLWLIGDDGDLLADKRIDERGFACVGPAHDRHET